LSSRLLEAPSDPTAVGLTPASFSEGGLPRESFVRPGKLFTASESIVVRRVGQLTTDAHRIVVEGVVTLLQRALK
jgi:mRNA interferase MazF